jgi:type IV pilus assembly protein PilV
MQLKRRQSSPTRTRGFTLIELMITLVVVSVGLLGLAKLQAAATAETQVSRTRSIMAYQAESLAGTMRANRAYWANATGALPTVSIAGGKAISSDSTGVQDCATMICNAAQMAMHDLDFWAAAYAKRFPAATAAIACGVESGPATCDITLTWPERYVAINRSTAPAAGGAPPVGTLVVHVQP